MHPACISPADETLQVEEQARHGPTIGGLRRWRTFSTASTAEPPSCSAFQASLVASVKGHVLMTTGNPATGEIAEIATAASHTCHDAM